MSNVARIPITNVHGGGDYTGQIRIGRDLRTMNVLFDTGSSQLAVRARSYSPHLAHGDRTTNLAQTVGYSDGSYWTGAVIRTRVSAGLEGSGVVLDDARIAIAYGSHAMFGKTDGILGLAYAALDDAYEMPLDTWTRKYRRLSGGTKTRIAPYLTQLKKKGVVFDRFAFYTRRSAVHASKGDPLDDPLNQGWLIVGSGEENRDLYRGGFQTARVLADKYYNTNLRAIVVGGAQAIPVAPSRSSNSPSNSPSNSIVDSGTNGIALPSSLLSTMKSNLPRALQPLFQRGAIDGQIVGTAQIDLAKWPDIVFVMEGRRGGPEAKLAVKPCDYWQTDAGAIGDAQSAFDVSGADDGIILGLPLMNGYFTVFDGEADNGKGEVRFAVRKD
jgi:hypothetical protein